MREYVVAYDDGGLVRVLVEWSKDAGSITIRLTGDEPRSLSGVRIVRGIEGEHRIHYAGKMFAISDFHHIELEEKFPTMNVDEQYIIADEWCIRKNKEIKNPYQFMTNWLKKARGGNAAAGSVVY